MEAITAGPERLAASRITQGSTSMVRVTRLDGGRTDLPPVVVLHGSPTTFPASLLDDALGTIPAGTAGWSMVRPLAASGYRCFAPFTGGNWGAPTSTTTGGTGTAAIGDCLTRAVAEGHAADEVLLLGMSMGGCNALAWAAANAAKVVAVFAACPAVDIVDCHARNVLGAQLGPVIEAQYGAGWATDCLPYSPAAHAATYPCGSVTSVVAGSDDPTVLPATITAWAADADPAALQWVTGAGHFVFGSPGWDDWAPTRWFDAHTGRD